MVPQSPVVYHHIVGIPPILGQTQISSREYDIPIKTPMIVPYVARKFLTFID